ncbi:MAG TPA: MlaD family protein [Isosphaeraceae bacterium]|nr:MlaD family protein [Isosphaeraceae bacterium]
MSTRVSIREISVGLIVILAVAGLIGLVSLASDGPGFLAPQRTLDVIFRDGQGIRVGSPVRVAGLDTGNVVDLDLVEVGGTLRARVRISLPANLVKKLRQDVKVAIQPALTGMSHVNILSAGRATAPLAPGEPVTGVESSFFDPIIEQVGLGPVERNDIRHMIAEARQTVDSVAPRLRQILESLQESSTHLREVSEGIRPAIESTVSQIEDLTRRIRVNSPKIESTLSRIENLTGEAQAIVAENRQNARQTVASVRDLTASLTDVVQKDRVKVERLLDGLDLMRARGDRVLYQADQIAGQVGSILVRSRAEIERSVSNVRDATDWADKLVQKIYTNPFVLSPFYKPSHEDLRVQGVYATALAFSHGAEELHDAVKTLDALMGRPATAQQKQEMHQIEQRVRILAEQLHETAQRVAESLKQPGGRDGRLRR